MEQRLSLVTLGVRDLAASRAFYQPAGLDGVTAEQRERCVLPVRRPGVRAVDPRCVGGGCRRASADGKGFANISLAQNVRSKEDVDATLKEAREGRRHAS